MRALITTIFSVATYVHSAIYYVAQGAPNASDDNPGAEEQPWKTLTHATEIAHEGDIVYIKAGAYREKLEPTNDGVTFSAFLDDRVVLEPANEVTEIVSGAWRKLPDREFVYVCDPKFSGDVQGRLMRVDNLAVAFEVTFGVKREMISGIAEMRDVKVDRILDDEDLRRWSVDREGKLYLNLGGEDPAKHRVQLIKDGPGGVVLKGNNCRVKGLSLHYCGISVAGQGNIVEDCLSLKGGGSCTGQNIIRRCTFYRCGRIEIGTNAVFEENLVVGSLRWVPEQQPPQVSSQAHYGGYLWNRAIGGNGAYYELIRYNVIADSAIWGFWNDCTGNGAYLYGNTFWRNWSGAIYNEDGCHDTRILYNALVENSYGIMLSGANRVFIAYNLIARNTHFGIGSSLTRQWPNPLDNVAQHNLIQGSPEALHFEGKAPLAGHDHKQLMTMTFDHNLYSLTPDGIFCSPGIATLSFFQELTKMEQNSRVDDKATMEDFGLGTVTFRIPDCDDPEEPVPMLANLLSRGMHQEPVGQDSIIRMDSPFFWNFGDGNQLPGDSWRSIYSPRWQFGWPFQRHGRWLDDATPGDPLPADGSQPFWLEASSEKPEGVPAEGRGWWSRSLPTVPGARIKVSLRVSGQDIEPAFPPYQRGVEGCLGQAVVAFVRFSSPTDQHVTQQFLIGGDEGEAVLKGAFPWQTFSKEFVAPLDARRFALFFGLRPCKGTARFAEVRIETLPGERPPELAMPKNVAYEQIDLTSFFNRDLDKNVTGRLKPSEGWPGPIDLSQLPQGKQVYAGVPFQIDRAIALRGSMFPQEESLPRKVRGIPLGRKVAGLYFLYRNVYPCPDRPQFCFVIQMADGSSEELPFFSGWATVKPRVKKRNLRLLPDNVIEWVNPRQDVVVEKIDFVSANTGESVLLAITAAAHK